MAHIEVHTVSGHKYLQIAESYYDANLQKQKKRIIKNLGSISKYDDGTPDFLERLRKDFRTGKIQFDGVGYTGTTKQEYHFDLLYQDEVTGFSVELKNLGYFFLEKLYNDLGIGEVLSDYKSRNNLKVDIGGITKVLCLNRVLRPTSKKSTYEQKDNFFKTLCSDMSMTSVYRTLTILAKKSMVIQSKMNRRISKSSIGRKTDLMYYDVTNYYFETMYGDEDTFLEDENGNLVLDEKTDKPVIAKSGFRKKGVSKEHRPEPIVQMGLFIDQNGIPVSFNLFPGNMQDKTTFAEMINQTIAPLVTTPPALKPKAQADVDNHAGRSADKRVVSRLLCIQCAE